MTLNVPLLARTKRTAHLRLFAEAVRHVESEFSPDFILVSAGYDALAHDPLASLLLEPEDFADLATCVAEWAERGCLSRMVVLLEGGYNPGRTGAAVVATLLALCEKPAG
jgi:acetoin utilization deacetylase AcuC-like enzyme